MAQALMRCFLAEGVAAGQACHWALPPGTPISAAWLPRRVDLSTAAAAQGESDTKEDHLRIAWQYRRYMHGTANAANSVQPLERGAISGARMPTATPAVAVAPPAGGAVTGSLSATAGAAATGEVAWCHSFALSEPMDAAAFAVAVSLSGGTTAVGRGPQSGSSGVNVLNSNGASHGIGQSGGGVESSSDTDRAQSTGAGCQGSCVAPSSQSQDPAIPMGTLSLQQTHTSDDVTVQEAATDPSKVPLADGSDQTGPSDAEREVLARNLAAVQSLATTAAAFVDSLGGPVADDDVMVSSGSGGDGVDIVTVSHSVPGSSLAQPLPKVGRIAVQSLGAGLQLAALFQPRHRHLPGVEIAGPRSDSSAKPRSIDDDLSTQAAQSQSGADTEAASLKKSHSSRERKTKVRGGRQGLERGYSPLQPMEAESAADAAARDFVRALFSLKAEARHSRCAVMVTIPADMHPDLLVRAQHMADAAVVLTALHHGHPLLAILPEPATCRGLVRMVKLPGVGVVVPPEPDHPVLLYRRARRHITLQPVDVDPDVVDPLAAAAAPAAAGVDVPPDVQEEDEEEEEEEDLDDDESDSVHTLGARPRPHAAGLLCGATRPPGAPSAFDF
mmetsp:Transcript_19412/g.58659  ORF Transcript_19412/g.58659 Transcript_19412/m.58659 type:complete len:615 (+) Transcript_19412:339-2183(+)